MRLHVSAYCRSRTHANTRTQAKKTLAHRDPPVSETLLINHHRICVFALRLTPARILGCFSHITSPFISENHLLAPACRRACTVYTSTSSVTHTSLRRCCGGVDSQEKKVHFLLLLSRSVPAGHKHQKHPGGAFFFFFCSKLLWS